MLKKKLGIEAIEKNWKHIFISYYYKIPPTLIIPEGCKRIGVEAFKNCWWLKKVVIPESVEIIGNHAFYECISATIILKKSKRKFKGIGWSAFYYCKSVEYAEKETRN